jgi:hypothetical protein
MKVYNMTFSSQSTEEEIKRRKSVNKHDLAEMINTAVGFQYRPELGIKCTNRTKKLSKSENVIKMLMVTIKNGDFFRLIDKLGFDQGNSCVEIKLEALKY